MIKGDTGGQAPIPKPKDSLFGDYRVRLSRG